MNSEQKVARISYYFHCVYSLYALFGAAFVVASFFDFFFMTNMLSKFFPLAIGSSSHSFFEKMFIIASLINVVFYFYIFFSNEKIWRTTEYNESLSRTFWWLFVLTHLSTLFLFFSCTKMYLPGLSLLGNNDQRSFFLSLFFMLPTLPLLISVFGLIENYLSDAIEAKKIIASAG
jgi:hypothetical protein